jgi:hypothetical protein
MAPLSPLETKSLVRKNTKLSIANPSRWISHIAVGIACFQIGFLIGGHSGGEQLHCTSEIGPPDLAHTADQQKGKAAYAFPDTLSGMFLGMGRVNRDEFFRKYDLGVPVDPSQKGNEDMLLLYGQRSHPRPQAVLQDTKDTIIPLYNATDATENCQVLKMILTEPKKKKHCIAIMGQWESYHIHKWMRLAENNSTKQVKDSQALQDQFPLRYVSRGHQSDGRYAPLPLPRQSQRHWSVLREYLSTVEATLKRLKPIAARVAATGNAIVVLVCNLGHSELLVNFACASRSRGLDITNVLVFATDNETKDLAESVGLSVFDVQDAFGKMPTKAAKVYGDQGTCHYDDAMYGSSNVLTRVSRLSSFYGHDDGKSVLRTSDQYSGL